MKVTILYDSVEDEEALPILEWDFSKLPDGEPKIASAEAKWAKESEAYKAPEIFPEDIPEPVYKKIQEAAIDAFKVLKLRDYGRVDLRLRRKPDRSEPEGEDQDSLSSDPARGKNSGPDDSAADKGVSDNWEFYIIEVNPNPYLDKKGELAIAAQKHGISYPDLLERIMDLALARHK